jgi:hypothetical protein
MSRKQTNDLIAEIHAESGANLDELTRLRDRIDELRDQLSDQEGPGDIVVATSKSFDVTKVLVEQGIYKTRHRGRDPVDQDQLVAIVAANLAYLQATMSAFSGRTPPS